MDIDLLIPFGYSNKTNEIIEPHEAERGRSCDAYCPGCQTPLISRHPKDPDKRIHFAHDSKHPKALKEKIKHCPFNGPFSIAYMARKLAPTLAGEHLKAADLKFYANCRLCKTILFEGDANKSKSIQIGEAESSHLYLNQTFDLIIKLDNTDILIWLEYPDRPFPDIDLKALKRTGVLKIEVNSFDAFKFKSSQKSFKDSVKEFLLREGKREWIHHPIAEARARLKAENASHTCVVYECTKCKSQWFHNIKKTPNCPKNCHPIYCKKNKKQPTNIHKDIRISWLK